MVRYLRTGEHDRNFTGGPGNDYLSCVTVGKQGMEDALVAEVRRMESGYAIPKLPAGAYPTRTLAAFQPPEMDDE